MLVLAACNASVVGPDEEAPDPYDNPIESFASKTDRSEVTYDFKDVTDTIFLPCLNDGQGGDAELTANYTYTVRSVTTPSGNTLTNGLLVEYDLQYYIPSMDQTFTGTGSGHVTFHFLNNGREVVAEPLVEVVEADDGTRLRILTLWNPQTWNDNDSLPYRIVSCQLK